ncbi:hypothetical protein KR084_002317 [Drosophila pseudotakahashii]|nr:hypothetical protein KR084_002317 [Drosophila pseudotakahashii]
MYLLGRKLELAVALVNILLAADPAQLLPNAYSFLAKGGRVVIICASGVLLFGTLMAQKQHRANFLLFWLRASVVFIATLIFEIRDGYRYFISLYLYIFVLVVMDALIYRVYVAEINTDQTKAVETDEKKEVPQATAPEDPNPPPYEVKGLTVQID